MSPVTMSALPFTVADVLRRHDHEGSGDRPAVVYGETTISYRELAERARRVATHWRSAGIERGDRVAMLAHNRPEWFDVLFAAALTGAVLVPLNYLLKPAEILHQLCDSGTIALVCEDVLIEQLPTLPVEIGDRFFVLGEAPSACSSFSDLLAAVEAPFAGRDVDVDDRLIFQYTSGTTGFPKAAVHTHSTVLWNTLHQLAEFYITAATRHLVVPALCWGAGFHAFTLGVLWAGGTVVLTPSRHFTGERFCRAVAEHSITHSVLVPSALRRVLDGDAPERFDMRTLSMIDIGGESASPALLGAANQRFPGCRFVYTFGQTEFPAFITYIDSRSPEVADGAVGRPSLIATVGVMGADGLLGPGEQGELVCRSPATMRGYHDQPEVSEAALRDGWLHTGDSGYVDDRGCVYVIGREKEMIISGGLNVYPAEVERVLLDHEGVAEAAVVAVPHPLFGESPRAHVVLAAGADVAATDLDSWAHDQLATYKVPTEWVIQTEPLPRTASGKVNKQSLRDVAS